ncbi:glycoside hydrolase family 2 TIM barrel-domain containing protein [Flammeovirga pacifica]|uniref:Glycoside hydrolase n=1 Tax=Flammeovirga pacifica TaxID=915059 RepID=A0A1S1Z048_FLAPC|nr:glycoside hydrolase family 2 TIM barrel-domain containing protein [Flammeovirga pacifica]OHX66617.1 glycoside hydrolase [Flammeovirga pacifica]
MIKHKLRKLGIGLVCGLISCSQQLPQQEEYESLEEISFNEQWKFSKGESTVAMNNNFDDTSWRTLNLPHDWAIEGPFDIAYNSRCGGLPVHGEAWYRKAFEVPSKMDGKKAFVHFEGVMNNAEVFLNGKKIGERPYGYIGFEVDMTSNLKYGEENIIAVKCAPEDLSARWYPGAGIYRDVWIEFKNPIHIALDGTFIKTPVITSEKADVVVDIDLVNTLDKKELVTVETIIQNAKGEKVGNVNSSYNLNKNEEKTISQVLKIENPELWSMEKPHLYFAVTFVKQGDTLLDKYVSSFGVRDIKFLAKEGFLLNGKRIQLKGVCLHHDQGPLGTAVNRRAKERQLQIMKDMGVNAIRTSHNPPSKVLLELCDEMGLVVIDEAFDNWKIGKVENGYNKDWGKWSEKDLRALIRRDRNHPSVIMWSIGNEILEQTKKDGWKEARRLAKITKSEDITRPVTAGFNYHPLAIINKLAHEIDVVGFNYFPIRYEKILEEYPDWVVYGSETSSCTSSRGYYDMPIEPKVAEGSKQVTSYDLVGPPWAYPPDLEFDMLEKNPKILGEFMWTGFDYLGEPTPFGGKDNWTKGYWNDDWPSHSSYFGAADLCGFPKDRYYLYQSQWTDKPMVHVLPHWNWEGKEGEIIPVHAFTNAEEVELIVNGKSYGKKVKGKDLTPIKMTHRDWKSDKPLMSKYRLSWDVPYTPGKIEVIAYTNNKEVARKEISTAGKPHHIVLEADRNIIASDGKDLSYVTVKVVDKDGNFCYTASNDIQFDIEGDGVLAGVGNGDATSLTTLKGDHMEVFNGIALAIIQGTKNGSNPIRIKATAEGLGSAEAIVAFQPSL